MTSISAQIKRFIQPLCAPIILSKALFSGTVLSLYGIYNVVVLQQISEAIERSNFSLFQERFFEFVVINIIFFFLGFILRNWGAWVATYYENIKNIHRDYMARFIALDNNTIEGIGTGRLVAIIEKGIRSWTNLLVTSIERGIKLVVTMLFVSFTMIQANPWFFLGFIASFFLILWIVHLANTKAIQNRKLRIESENSYSHQLVKIIMSKFEILQNNKSTNEIRVLDHHSQDAGAYNLGVNTWLFWIFNTPRIFLFLLRIATYGIVGYGIFRQTFTLSDLVGFVALLALLETTVLDFVDFFKNGTQEFPVVQKLWDTFDNTPEIKGYETGERFDFQEGNIELENLSYSYGESIVFSNLSFKIGAGKKTALVGLSGSGKSTLVKLIAGYLHPTGGSVVVDGQDLAAIKLRDYYGHIGYLTQEPSVFDGTIIENLTYGARSDISDKELRQAIELAQCEFIYDFKDGLKTDIGEKGVRLSGGQRQRLAIAKIFIKNPEIIILDEPTSALDSFSEEKISQAFHNLFQGRTVIVIAHRLQTVKEADDIIVLEHGKIAERGNHTELVEKKGVYAKMLELQSGF